MPSFFDSAFRNETSISSEKPRSFKLMCVLSFSSILRTTRSPKDDGKVETRKSTSFFPILIDIRPSCGSLRSDISNLDIIFILEIIICVIFF